MGERYGPNRAGYVQEGATDIMYNIQNVGGVHPVVGIPVFVFGVASVVVTGVAAYEYNKANVDLMMKGTNAAVSPLSSGLYVSAALQLLLLVLLLARGMYKRAVGTNGLFSWTAVQMVMILHTITPNLFIFTTWAARFAIDAAVVEVSNRDHLNGHKLKAAFALHTSAAVFSNLYSAFAFAILFANTAFFIRSPDDFAFFGSGSRRM